MKFDGQEARVTALIGNEASPYTDDCKEFLMGLDETQLKIQEDLVANQKVEKKEEEIKTTVNTVKEEKVEDKKEEPITAEQYVNNAPPEIQEVLKEGQRLQAKNRANLISKITANKLNTLSQNQLNAMDMLQLEAIAKLATPPADYTGQGGGAPLTNSEVEPLVMPSCFPEN